MLQRCLTAALLLLAPGVALAHSPMPGVGSFYGGLLHPVMVPSHLITLVALGLLIGQRGLGAMRLTYPCFLVALTGGLIVAGWSPEAPGAAQTVLLALAGGCGLAVAFKLPAPRALLALVTVITAAVIGADSGITGLSRQETFGALLGAGAGACLLLLAVAGLAELPQREWQRIAVRVLGSWCAATAALVLALTLQ